MKKLFGKNITYLNNPKLKSANVEIDFTKKQISEYIKCKEDPIYFAENYVKIINVDDGLVPFRPYEFQKRMITSFINERFLLVKCPRQSGKSTTILCGILHEALFKSDQNIAILANKGHLARELLGRLQLAYEYLPFWLQQGVQVWNKSSIELENGTKVIAAATSSSAVRGGSFNCIHGESEVVVKDKAGNIKTIKVSELKELLEQAKSSREM